MVGASRRPESVGRAILRNIVSGGYAGRVYVVNPHASELEGVPCLPSAAALPEPVDLAVVAVPAPAVLEVAEECGQRGVRGARGDHLGAGSRGPGGPAGAAAAATECGWSARTAFGVAVPGIGLNATFAASHPAAGLAGLAVQSGGVGIALLEQLTRLGIGISSFASLGDKADVSGNDLLHWWQQDPATKLAVLYLESFGNPRKFGRTARRVGATMPVLTVDAGRSEAGSAPPPRTPRPRPRPWSPARRCSGRPASSPPATSASCSTRPRCWPASRCRRAAGSRSSPTPAGPGCSPPTPAPTRA